MIEIWCGVHRAYHLRRCWWLVLVAFATGVLRLFIAVVFAVCIAAMLILARHETNEWTAWPRVHHHCQKGGCE